jgi:hypothetical protein
VILISIIVCLRLRRKTYRKKKNKDVPDTDNTYISSFWNINEETKQQNIMTIMMSCLY